MVEAKARIQVLEAENAALRLELGEPVTMEELTSIVGAKAATSLLSGSFNTRAKINAASNDELEALPDVGEASRKKLRDWLAS